MSELTKKSKKIPPPTKQAPVVTVITYNADEIHEQIGFTATIQPQSFNGVTWINVEGLEDVKLVKQVAKQFNLHPLTIEDILNVEQRPKVEEFEDYLFITLKALMWDEKNSTFLIKQLSLVLGKNFVLSFQEFDTTLFDIIRSRLQSTAKQRLREQGSDYLAYRLIDVVVDNYFTVLEVLGDQIEKVEDRIISYPTPQNARTIYRLKRQMLVLRKAIWPMREAIGRLLHVEEMLITKFTYLYLRDVYDHCVQAIDTLETFRDILSGMLDMYLSSLTNRMNEIMKTLTIITTIFIPITAIASIYGMNFTDLPGIHSHWGYAIVLGIMLLIAVLMIAYFKKKKWF